MGKPDIYPTGVTIYKPDKAWNGYTIFPSELGATVIDMNGQVAKVWQGVRSSPVNCCQADLSWAGSEAIREKPGKTACWK